MTEMGQVLSTMVRMSASAAISTIRERSITRRWGLVCLGA